MQRDDIYKSGTIYTGPGEPPSSQSRPTPRPKQVPGKPITKGKLLRPGGPGGGQSRLAARPAASRPTPQPTPQAAPKPAVTQPRPVPQPQPNASSQRAVPQPLAAINGISHGRSESSSSIDRGPPPPPPAAPPAARKNTYIALYDFEGQHANELTIHKNDIVEVMQKEPNGKHSPFLSHAALTADRCHFTTQAGGSPNKSPPPPKAGRPPPT